MACVKPHMPSAVQDSLCPRGVGNSSRAANPFSVPSTGSDFTFWPSIVSFASFLLKNISDHFQL